MASELAAEAAVLGGSNGACASPVSALAETTCVDCDSALTEAESVTSGFLCLLKVVLILHMLSSCLTDDLHFHQTPPGSSIPVGARLLSARHVDLSCPADLAQVPLTSKRVWMRVADVRSVKRKLSAHSRKFLEFWKKWATSAPCLRSLSSVPRDVECLLAADAFGRGTQVGIGGFLQFPGSEPLWFSERLSLRDFAKLQLPFDPDAQRDITCWEAMAQLGLVILFSESVPGGRVRVCIPSFSDNTGAPRRRATSC